MSKNQKLAKFSTKPPFFAWILRWRFGFDFEKHVVAFGDTIHSKYQIPSDLFEHECAHLEMQGYSKVRAVAWWARYLFSKKFRMREEVLGYGAQLRHIDGALREKHEAHKFDMYYDRAADELSSHLYGHMCTYGEAKDALRRYLVHGLLP